ncbi:MAG: glycosyltransferase family 4 protein [Pseudomonadota bacterium]
MFATFLLSCLLCWLYLQLARRLKLLDSPNARSAHQHPTPNGGGAAIYLAFSVCLLVANTYLQVLSTDYLLLAAFTIGLMLLGIIDDVKPLPVLLRLSAYGISCLVTAVLLLPDATGFGLWHALLIPIVAFIMLWMVNLYNFMDGIDGLAASQAVLVSAVVAMLALSNGSRGYAVFCLLIAAAQLGFLIWNWPRASLFMGDAGSVPTGYLFAALALLGAVQGGPGVACWLILLAVFVTDASWTLVWRFIRGQSITQAHRLHAYQRLSRHWDSHQKVVIAFVLVFLVWLTPLAWLAEVHPQSALLLVILAYLPLLLGMAKFRPLA